MQEYDDFETPKVEDKKKSENNKYNWKVKFIKKNRYNNNVI